MSMPNAVSMLDSYKFWNSKDRQAILGHFEKPKTYREWHNRVGDLCPICKGHKVFMLPNTDTAIYCICSYLRELDRLAEFQMQGSPWRTGISLDILQRKNIQSREGAEDLTKAKGFTQSWIENPSSWVYLEGGTGTGKTTILYAIKETLGPLAFYITMPDFQSILFARLNKGHEIEEFLLGMKGHTVLLLDDLGMEYGKSEWTVSMLASVINHRYTYADKLPMFVTSNLSASSLAQSPDINIRRIASRLVEGTQTQILRLRGEDYRIATQIARMEA